MGVRCVAHKTNLVIWLLFHFTIISWIEAFMLNISITCHKKHLEFQKLAQLIDTNLWNNLFWNVKTWWMNVLECLYKIMVEYKWVKSHSKEPLALLNVKITWPFWNIYIIILWKGNFEWFFLQRDIKYAWSCLDASHVMF
jgi:hypothetical protein